MKTHTYGRTPLLSIKSALPHKYPMELVKHDMIALLNALYMYSMEGKSDSDRVFSLRTSILETIGIEEI